MTTTELLAERIEANAPALEAWYRKRLAGFPGAEPPIYSSVDVRNANFKISVVDTNLFPAGFNNLCETFSERGAKAFASFLKEWHPAVRKILIFPEEHTRNLYYWKNVDALKSILLQAGMEVEVGSIQDGLLRAGAFVPDLILINNDLSVGTPEYLKNLPQVLLPSPHLGWHRRRKSEHFQHFALLAREVSEILGLDPWLITPLSETETGVDLSDEACLKRLKDSADRLLDRIRQKYREHGVAREPYLFVKNNAGTYGMGIIHIDSGDHLLRLNRKQRTKLTSSKGGQRVSEYLLQEGIPTADLYQGKPLEPVVYLVGGEAIGTFFRIHGGKNEMENLNAPGMELTCLCFHKVPNDPLFTAAAFLGKVASLASVFELSAFELQDANAALIKSA